MRTAGESGVVLEVLSLKDRNPPFVGAGCEPIVITSFSTPPQIRGARYTGRARDTPDTRWACSAGEWTGPESIELGVWRELFRDDSH
jgi:hypothetical protein